MPAFKTLDDLDASVALRGKSVLVRADLNVPVDANGAITDMTRITRFTPTVAFLADRGARVIILSHFGRPKGTDPSLSLKPIAFALAAEMGRTVGFSPDCIGEDARNAVSGMKDGDILMLENVRFHSEEEKNDPEFARAIAQLGDIYVNDAFSCAHRAHATTEGIAHVLPAYAGYLMAEELSALDRALHAPERPVLAIVGGAKISTKLDLLGNLVKKTDVLVLGGGMANTFLAAQGVDVGASLCEKDMLDTARAIMATAQDAGCTIVLPIDGVIAKSFKAHAASETMSVQDIPKDGMMLDIGLSSVEQIEKHLTKVKTVVWNGPLGAFELEPFDAGTTAVAKAVANRTANGDLVTIAGGGDTVAALAHAGVIDDLTYVSAAGGAFLEWLEGKTLPGVKALELNAR